MTNPPSGDPPHPQPRRASCLYEGTVHHRRMTPKPHDFRYRIFQMYLDLDEVDTLFVGTPFWSSRRPALARFERGDHLGDPRVPLRTAVLDQVESRIGRRPGGAVRLLTHLRYFGCLFNPVSFYYLFDRDERLDAWVAHVNNTPWGESHVYTHDAREAETTESDRLRFRSNKEFHVSPFLEMDYEYDWLTTTPRRAVGDHLAIRISNQRARQTAFTATLELTRREISPSALNRVLVRYPFLTARVVGAIYLQAASLWWKGVPFQPHPERGSLANTQGKTGTTDR